MAAGSMQISSCPICGLPFEKPVDEQELRHSYWICECCGCEYGYDDHSSYREQWIKNGAKWQDEKLRPPNWNLEEQLKNIIPDWNNR
jgi:hypothetical protein